MNQNPAKSAESALSRESAVSGPSDIDSSYPEGRQSTLGKIYPTSCGILAVSGAPSSHLVADGLDSTPTNWFELGAELCLSGRISETRFRRAIEAVRKGVDRE